MKRLLTSVLAVTLICGFSFSALAAPDYIGGTDSSGASGLITVTNPDKTYSTTYNISFSLTGSASNGAAVYVYISDGNGGYRPYTDNGVNVSAEAGSSGLFVIPVKLSSGKNSFLLHAESDGEFQDVKFEVNLLSASMYNLLIKGLKIKFK
jgi:hypothetical protein